MGICFFFNNFNAIEKLVTQMTQMNQHQVVCFIYEKALFGVPDELIPNAPFYEI